MMKLTTSKVQINSSVYIAPTEKDLYFLDIKAPHVYNHRASRSQTFQSPCSPGMSHHHIFLICWSLIRNGSLLLLYNVQPQVLNLYLKVILVASMSNFTVVEVHTIILDFSRSRFLSTFVKKHPGIHHKINNFKVGPIKSLLRIRWSAVSMCNP